MRCVTRAMQTRTVRGERAANRYCFRATVHLTSSTTPAHLATFTGHDKTPEVGKAVQTACQDYADANPVSNCWCTAAELVVFEECPVECSGDVTVVVYDESVT